MDYRVFSNRLTRKSAREDFVELCHRESLEML
jgi:hypothetical protein